MSTTESETKPKKQISVRKTLHVSNTRNTNDLLKIYNDTKELQFPYIFICVDYNKIKEIYMEHFKNIKNEFIITKKTKNYTTLKFNYLHWSKSIFHRTTGNILEIICTYDGKIDLNIISRYFTEETHIKYKNINGTSIYEMYDSDVKDGTLVNILNDHQNKSILEWRKVLLDRYRYQDNIYYDLNIIFCKAIYSYIKSTLYNNSTMDVFDFNPLFGNRLISANSIKGINYIHTGDIDTYGKIIKHMFNIESYYAENYDVIFTAFDLNNQDIKDIYDAWNHLKVKGYMILYFPNPNDAVEHVIINILANCNNSVFDGPIFLRCGDDTQKDYVFCFYKSTYQIINYMNDAKSLLDKMIK